MVTDQKYHKLLCLGLKKNGADVYCFSGLPINRTVTEKNIINETDDVEDGIHYHYYTTINISILRQIMVLFGGFFNILFRKRFDCLVCDFMSTMNSYGMTMASLIRKIPVIEIVMDLPGLMNTTGEQVRGIYRRLSRHADGFVLLTQQMNEVVNNKKVPFIVVEGHVDSGLAEVTKEEKWEYQEGKKVIIYAGGIHRIFGIEMLVKGFIKASIENSELRIFGDGDYRGELLDICRTHSNIHYMGVMDNEEVVYQEQRAALLVNPRPSSPIYTNFSFPSKNMEYMISGTPIMTTNLPGMPKEYKKYVYFIERETEDGIAESLTAFFSLSSDSRYEKGKSARSFVLEKKNNIIQAAKIIDLLTDITKNRESR